ncbi:MAG: precorrin-6Y C5,15-methyltransferase (decarboxylating) subunit CbiT [Candidatus Acididesulfobacter guangdongensis]|uniref:Precorrin-6Y C5,15-methyltransferase (Decarboxylating) subunit CbiT n=1 Tax=Acididesulfobacter guangdongensis TaxID=2597225 RepID=A0A519BFN0_ACIG2|nr:MAG: precorrin-6Y C5,15-methyltransferase (decarboxylating) subunit CbiT [Candidatus Acididesulfobacter guangdongensis]
MKLNKIYIIGVSKCFSANISLEQSILKISHIDSIFARKEDEYILKKIKHEHNIIKSSQIFYGSKIQFILDYITENITKKNILVLADGDPNFFGIAGTIFNNTDEKFRRYIEIFPAASYMQKGFASIGISMSDSEIISLHGRNVSNLFKALYTSKNIGIYTDKINNPFQIYKILMEKGFSGYYKFHVLSELCSKNEKTLSLNIKTEQNSNKINIQKALEEFEDTKNIVILEHVINKKNNVGENCNNGGADSCGNCNNKSRTANNNTGNNIIHTGFHTDADISTDANDSINGGAAAVADAGVKIIADADVNANANVNANVNVNVSVNILGINDDDFIHGKGEPTKKEIRAAALSMLELKRNSVVLDAGCGSGSVSIEAAAVASEGMIYSIDKNKIKINNLLKNIKKFKRPNIEAMLGDMPAIFNYLKDKFAAEHIQPDSIFVGGGGISIDDIIQTSFEMLKSGGIIVVNCVMIDTLNKVMSYIENNKSKIRYEIISLNISRLESISYSSYFKALNQVYLIKIIRTK